MIELKNEEYLYKKNGGLNSKNKDTDTSLMISIQSWNGTMME
jgi:hypothetical protein